MKDFGVYMVVLLLSVLVGIGAGTLAKGIYQFKCPPCPPPPACVCPASTARPVFL